MKYIKHFETWSEANSFFDETDRDFPCIAIADSDKISIDGHVIYLNWYNEYKTPHEEIVA